MKKLLTITALIAATLSSCKYDDDDLWSSVHGLEDRVAKLEELCKQMNTNISSLRTIVEALEENDYVTNVTPLMQNGKEIGYTIVFSKSNPITIYHGKDGQDGGSSTTPSIGVKLDTDGIYYWTLNGEWLTDDHGDKIKAEGADGNDGTTPKFKIENDYWHISYNNGETWEQLGKATGEDGKDGNSIFKAVTQDDKNVYFELTDGTIITIAKSDQTEEVDTQIIQFKDAKVKAICVQNWDTNDDGELSYGEAAKVTSIRKFFRGTTIQSFDELQYFTGIDEIGTDAFRQCKNLTNITIPQNVIWIEEYAFSGCNSLNDIIIPKNVTWIGSYAFDGCSSLTNITIPNSVTTIGNSAFNGCSSLTDITIPNSVTTIGVSAFNGCSSLTDITIPNSVTTIGVSAFDGCSSLTNITIPNSVTTIGSLAFDGCSSLTNITIPNSVTTIGSSAFSNCSKLKEIHCTPINPPTLGGNTVFSSIASNAVFYVPSASVNNYKTADVWKTFADQIVGYDF